MALFGVCLFQCRYTLTQARALRWSMGLMGTRGLPPLHRGVVAASTFTHVARSVQASREPRLTPFPAPRCARGVANLRVLPAPRLPLRHWRASAADRGTARCGRRARKPEQGPRAIQQPPCTLAPCLVRDRSPAMRRDSSDARSWAREGGPHGPCSRPHTTPFVL